MAYEVVMPRLGWNMETGRLGEWLKAEGEHVEAGELLFTVESDKAIQEIEALEAGILRIPPGSPPPGVEVPVGTLLGYLLAEGEALPAVHHEPVSPLSPQGDAQEPAAGPAGNAPTARTPGVEPSPVAPPQMTPSQKTPSQMELTISPRARRVARELGVDWTGLQGSGRTGRIVERDVRRAAELRPQAAAEPAPERVSPLARRRAADLGVDLGRLAAQMPGRRIEVSDVEAAVARPHAEIRQPPVPTEAETVSPISVVRRTIAERMAASAHTTAPVTLSSEVDATELVRLRRQLAEDKVYAAAGVPSYTALLVKLCAAALLEHPAVNARFEGDTIVQAAGAHIGIAVDTERGLLVPVLRDAQAKSLREIARASAALIERARTGRISPEELRGGTFTVTNLGMYGIDAFTPIINLPECAIMGVGRIVPKQVVIDAEAERLAIRHMMFLSLTFDHRLVDGGPAARFLQRITQYVEKPYLWLAG